MNAPSKIAAALPDAPALAAAFERIARGNSTQLAQDLVEHEANFQLQGTNARTHCYGLALDGMGWPRTHLLIENICNLVIEYAIPRSKIQEAAELCEDKNLQGPIVSLANEARGLFTHLSQTGEGGELLLFCFAEMILGYPQVLAKMHLKTAADIHYHGADGVHASVDDLTKQLTLWWGESKLHKTAAGATRECIKSLAPFLIEPQSSQAKRDRDLKLLRYGVDLDDQYLEQAIKAYLDTSNPMYKKLKFGGIGLVGFNDQCYPIHPAKADADEIAAAIELASAGWKNGLKKHINTYQLEEIDIHLFFIPFPSVKDFRAGILKAVGAK